MEISFLYNFYFFYKYFLAFSNAIFGFLKAFLIYFFCILYDLAVSAKPPGNGHTHTRGTLHSKPSHGRGVSPSPRGRRGETGQGESGRGGSRGGGP